MRSAKSSRRLTEPVLVLLACLAGIALRLWLATRAHNYDMESWSITADLVAHGKNVYANTYRHPYGPVWFLVLGGLRHAHDALGLARLGPESFHVVVASFLSLVDVAIAWLLFRALGLVAALFFVLNPVSILITGYHSQFDNLAILLALGAWLLLWGPEGRTRLMASAALLGLSLATKHVLIFFPLWVVMCPRLIGPIGRRAAYAGSACAIAAATVVPFLFAPGAWTGFVRHVVRYEPLYNHTLLLHVIDIFAPPEAVNSLFGLVPAGVGVLARLFAILMLLAGWLVARRAPPRELLWCYLLALLVLTVQMGDQYLAIPLVACAAYWRRWPAWVYVAPATLLAYWAGAEAGALPLPRQRWEPYLSHWSYPHAQVWLAVLLALTLWRPACRGRRGGGGEDQVRA